MVGKEPRYWGSWKGRVLKAVALSGEQTWIELSEKTGLNEVSLNRVLSELYDAGAIKKTAEGKYRVINRDLYKEYKTFLEEFEPLKDSGSRSGLRYVSNRFLDRRKKDIVNWIEKWKSLKKLEFSVEAKHFFLEGRYLDDISKELISSAKLEVLAVNPYVDDCDLSNTLREACKKARVVLVTHAPEDKFKFPKDRQEYHMTLKDDGVTLIYNKKAHAKLIVVDRALAIVSSMNFYSGSSGGAAWEAGLVSFEDTVVESVVDSILNLVEKPESREMRAT